ncbi:hypothetical protein V5738_12520 [Salinisphaera sp. SPP-AMP-43]|uniref:hypothetical protein n=1 Tax=Salinisphaera sp. SPP-AMP-43 TaxID=3121288 RepID=UPI003C6E5B73
MAETVTLMTLALVELTASAWALAGEIAPTSMRAAAGSIQNCGSDLEGAFSPLAGAFIHGTTGLWAAAFISGGLIAAAASVCHLLFVHNSIDTSAAASAAE